MVRIVLRGLWCALAAIVATARGQTNDLVQAKQYREALMKHTVDGDMAGMAKTAEEIIQKEGHNYSMDYARPGVYHF